ncbi:MAG: hypothetical protein AB7L13_03710 [Acidimicrobiia bacterium]
MGDRVVAASAVTYVIAMFLPWYGTATGAFHGWHYPFSGVVPFVVVAVLTVQMLLSAFTITDLPSPRLGWHRVQLIGGIGVALVMLTRAAVSDRYGELTLDRKYGLVLALVSALGLAFGGWLKFHETADGNGAVAGPSSSSGSAVPPLTDHADDEGFGREGDPIDGLDDYGYGYDAVPSQEPLPPPTQRR